MVRMHTVHVYQCLEGFADCSVSDSRTYTGSCFLGLMYHVTCNDGVTVPLPRLPYRMCTFHPESRCDVTGAMFLYIDHSIVHPIVRQPHVHVYTGICYILGDWYHWCAMWLSIQCTCFPYSTMCIVCVLCGVWLVFPPAGLTGHR